MDILNRFWTQVAVLLLILKPETPAPALRTAVSVSEAERPLRNCFRSETVKNV
jgi:hypothetical protein